MTPTAGAPDPSSLTIRSSIGGIAFASLGGLSAALVAVAVFAANGVGPMSVVVGAVGLVIVGVVLFDMPLSASFDRAGIVRRTPLRRHRMDWDDIERLTRMSRRSLLVPWRTRHVGIVAVRGPHRVLLVDRTETPLEHERLLEVSEAIADDVRFERLGHPAETAG